MTTNAITTSAVAQSAVTQSVATRNGVRSAIKAVAATLMAMVVILMTTAGPAAAHTGLNTILYVDVSRSAVSGRIEAPIPDLAAVLDIALDDAEDAGESVLPELEARQDEIHAYFDEHFTVGADGETWPLAFGDVELFFPEEDAIEESDNYLVIPFEADVTAATGSEVPRQFDIDFDPFVDEMGDRYSEVLIANDWAAGVYDNGWDVLQTLNADTRSTNVDLGEPDWFNNFLSSGKLGLNHIQTGPDHVLFVLVLLLPSVLVFAGSSWAPTAGFLSSLWRVLKIVTMFTIAHSITFTLAGLGVLPLPSSKIVESIIALSIAAAAIHNIRPIFPNREWLLAFAFGLFHGMGFASLVEGLDVSRGTQLVSLFGRNVGIEVGQAIVVLLLFPGLFLLRRTRFYRPFFVVVSILMAIISLAWMIERIGEVDLGVNGILEPIFAWPELLIFAAVFTALTAAAFAFERYNNNLLAVAGESDAIADLERERVSA